MNIASTRVTGSTSAPAAPATPGFPTAAPPNGAGKIADTVDLSPPATTADVPRFRNLLRASTQAHLASLPAAVALALATCERSVADVGLRRFETPETQAGIRAIRDLAAQIAPGVLAEANREQEVAESRRFREGFLLPTDNPPDLAAKGQALMDRLEGSSPSALQTKVVVLDGPTLMAFVRGGENLYVGQDVLDLPEEEAAAILAHERAHLLERHPTLASICTEVGLVLAAHAAGSPPVAAAIKQLGTLATAGLQREQEFRADALGSDMLERAGYPRSAMARVLTRLQGDRPETSRPTDDHPLLSARLQALSASAPAAQG